MKNLNLFGVNMKPRKTKIIAIDAPSGGGKTTITNRLKNLFANSKSLHFDDRDYDNASGITNLIEWYIEGADVNRYDLKLLANDIDMLLDENPDYIFLDYPFGYRHHQIRKYIDFSIFIDTPLDITFARRLLRDFKQDTAASILADVDLYLQQGRPLYIYAGIMARKEADLLVDGSMTIDEIVATINKEITRL